MVMKKTRGRQRIEIVKMQDEARLHVTFSKRRYGLFKKVNELCILIGAEVAAIIFSPGKSPFSFGSPSVESIIGRFRSQTPQPFCYANAVLQMYRKFTLKSLNNKLEHMENHLKTEKMSKEMLNQSDEVIQSQYLWKAPIEELRFEQLQELKLSMQILRERIPIETGVVVSEQNVTDFPLPQYLEKNAYDIYDPLFDFSYCRICDCLGIPTNFEAPGTFDFSENVAGPTGVEDGSLWTNWASNSSSGADFNLVASGVGAPEFPRASGADFNLMASGVGAPEMPHASVANFNLMASGVGASEFPHASGADFNLMASGVGAPEMPHASVANFNLMASRVGASECPHASGADFNLMASGVGAPEMPHASVANFNLMASGVGAPEFPHASVADFSLMASGVGALEIPHASGADFSLMPSGVGAPEMPHASLHGYGPTFF